MHKAFWRGEGPSLILVPTREMPLYDIDSYRERFYDPQKMWESEMARTEGVLDWPTDGIPTVRPNLGVTFIPAMAGQTFEIRPGHMPWPGKPLTPDEIRAARNVDVTQTEVMKLAAQFYRIHAERILPIVSRMHRQDQVIAYQADNQGIFDVAHLIYGDEIFLDIVTEEKQAWVGELLEISCDLMIRASVHVKKLIGEKMNTMAHGHATPQGIYFTNAGLRISEDSPTMISPELIDRLVIPPIERCGEQFGGIFMHYCGKHEYFFERLCRCNCVKAIDLGDPWSYDTRRLLETCAETDTVLYSRVGADENETWSDYVTRLGKLVQETAARCVLRPVVFPDSRADCEKMHQLWHELTAK